MDEVHTLGGFSAHADYAGLLEWARAIPGKPRFLVNHGEPDPAHALAAKLRSELGAEAEAAKPANMND